MALLPPTVNPMLTPTRIASDGTWDDKVTDPSIMSKTKNRGRLKGSSASQKKHDKKKQKAVS